jgi:dihydroorotase-like cyclic amidohydrolase
MPGVELLFPILFSEGVAKEKISISVLTKVLMENPAKIFGLFPKKGTLIPGSDADMVVFDPEKKWTVLKNELHPNVGWSPYEGMELTGKVDMTIVRGKIVFNKGETTAPKGYGRFIRPTETP